MAVFNMRRTQSVRLRGAENGPADSSDSGAGTYLDSGGAASQPFIMRFRNPLFPASTAQNSPVQSSAAIKKRGVLLI